MDSQFFNGASEFVDLDSQVVDYWPDRFSLHKAHWVKILSVISSMTWSMEEEVRVSKRNWLNSVFFAWRTTIGVFV